MEQRLIQLLQSEGMNPTRFAERIGVQRSSISHILSGRNKPSYDFIIKILDSFPSVNPDWLLRGKGLMYKSDLPLQPGLFDKIETVSGELNDTHETEPASRSMDSENQASYGPEKNPAGSLENLTEISETHMNKRIEKIIILYSDKTFSDYLPGN